MSLGPEDRAPDPRLAAEPWLTSPATKAVMAALTAEGGPDCVRFVGGCVRNALMGMPVDDLDLATALSPDRTMAALKAAGLKVVPTGLAHGTVTAVSGRRPYEITTLRRDVETDGRRATVAFTDDWSEDAARRDFRMNALYADPTGAVFDPTGEGLADVEAGRVVFVGEAETRIREDYLRILRFFRFFAWYGRAEPDAEGLAACGRLAEGLGSLSAERVSRELLKLLAAPDPRPALGAMADSGVLDRLLPEGVDPGRGAAMAAITPDPVLRLSALLPDDPAVVEATARRLRLPNAVTGRLVEAVGDGDELTLDDRAGRRRLYRIGRIAFEDRIARALAGLEATADATGADEATAGRLMALARDWPVPALPVGGRQIGAAGLQPGPDTGRALRLFEAGWIADDFPDHGHAERLAAVVAEVKASAG